MEADLAGGKTFLPSVYYLRSNIQGLNQSDSKSELRREPQLYIVIVGKAVEPKTLFGGLSKHLVGILRVTGTSGHDLIHCNIGW